MAGSNRVYIQYNFESLDKTITYEEGKLLLDEFIKEWNVLSKRYSLSGEADSIQLQRLKFYTNELIERFPQLELLHLRDYYDEAIAEYTHQEYIVRRDRNAQNKAGFKTIIFDGKGVYLFNF